MTKAFAVANGVALAAFALSTAVQYNDPDPVQWAAIYLAATAACALAYRSQGGRLALIVGAIALVWAATLAPGVVGHARIADAFARMEEHRPVVEETREMLGLLIVASWMAGLAIRARAMNHRKLDPADPGS